MEINDRTEIMNEIISWAKTIICAVIFALCINNFVIVNASVPTPSMENTIIAGDRILANRLSYISSDPQRFDVVVFRYPDDETVLYVKRIIGMPGETLEIIDGKIYINGLETPLSDDFVKEPPLLNDYGPVTVPENHYFMMGDNRNHSEDSRYWNNTYLERTKILGKVLFKYYPKFKMLI